MTKLSSDACFSNLAGRRRKLLHALVLAASSTAWIGIVHAEPADASLYRYVLKDIFEHDKPRTFAVWDHPISSETMSTPRVPRHEPYRQLVRSLRGLPAELEQTLLASAAGHGTDDALPKFDVPASAAAFSGFLDSARLKQAERAADSTDPASRLIAVGFSRVAYADRGRSALMYAETCLSGSDELCGATGYWFVKAGSGWRLKRRTHLWQGVTDPFWGMPAAVAVNTAK